MRYGVIPLVLGIVITILMFSHVHVPGFMPLGWKLGIYVFGFLMVMGALKLIFDTIAGFLFWGRKKGKGE